ncbi:PssE/Cps14G family polysaccharide biosynthesis glycosyltransferase [Lachnospiraceae bacterium C1.1]|nr:PssE/Cps14G family polysaccharide biosynthesis glycosyltransferase [Lachnospiraceae bacterium C1.1]
MYLNYRYIIQKSMIFITLGSQKFQFNRLLKAVDEQVRNGKISDKIFAQIGASDYKPINFEYKDFLNRDEFAEAMTKSDIVITHGGTGAIIGAVKKGKKVIAIPRRKKYGEHVDDHQIQLIRQFKELNLIYECLECDDISKAIDVVKKNEYEKYNSNTQKIIKSIEEFIEKEL